MVATQYDTIRSTARDLLAMLTFSETPRIATGCCVRVEERDRARREEKKQT